MECSNCGLQVLVQDGAVTPHLRPDTMQLCESKPALANAESAPAETAPKKTTAASKAKPSKS